MKPTKEVYFSPPELEWIAMLEEMGSGPIHAREYVINYKRDMAIHHRAQGNKAMYRMLMEQIGEWDESLSDVDPTAALRGRVDVDKDVKIILK